LTLTSSRAITHSFTPNEVRTTWTHCEPLLGENQWWIIL